MTTIHIACPFPPCALEWWIGAEPGQSTFEIPLHMPQGFEGAERFELRCPGCVILVRVDGPDAPAELNAPDTERINRAYENYLLRLAHEHEATERRAEAERGKTGPYIGFPVGRAVDPEVPDANWFPGRPADAPEPGPGESHPQVEIGTGHHLGRAAMEDAHDTTRGLVILAKGKMEEARGKLSACATALNGAVGIATMAEIEATAGNALVIAAVGSGAGKPQPADRMAEQMALAVDTIMGSEGGNIFNAIDIARIRVETAAQQLSSAIANAERYIALLS